MPLSLESLIFNVETEKLKEAKDAIDALAVAMGGLGSTQKNGAKSTESNSKALSAAEKVQERVAAKVELLRSGTVKLKDQVIDLGKGFTSSQASMLANLKVMKASSSIIRTVAEDFRNLNAISAAKPFDPTVAGLEKIRKDAKELTLVNDYMAKGFNLTKEQVTGLARDIESLTQQYRLAGKPQEELNIQIEKTEKETVQAAQALNALIASSELATKKAKEHAQAEIKRAYVLKQSADKITKESYQTDYIKSGSSRATANVAASMQVKGVSKDVIDSYIKEATAKEKAVQSVKDYNNSLKSLAVFEERAFATAANYNNILQKNSSVTDKASLNIANYEKLLKQAGITGEVAAKKLSAFTQQQQDIVASEAKIKDINLKKQASLKADKELYQTNYMSLGVSKVTANVAASMQVKGVPQDVIDSYIKEATAKEKAAQATRDYNSALKNLNAADERASNTIAAYNNALESGSILTEKAAINIANYERWLKQAGITGEVAASRLSRFSKQQSLIAEQTQKQQEAYLQRALIPQFSDIFVGLTTGMNPLTVALQQLPQIQDLFTLTGVRAQDTVRVISEAASQMFYRLKDTGIAVTQAIGIAFGSLGSKIIFLDQQMRALDKARSLIVSSTLSETSLILKTFDAAATAVRKTAAIVGGIFVTSLAASVVGLYQIFKANNEVTKSLYNFGAATGLTRTELLNLAEESAKFGASSNEIKSFFATLIEGGIKSKNVLKIAAEGAASYRAITGKSLDEIAKGYINLSKDPLNTLIEIAKQAGFVDLQTIKVVQSLIKQGRVAEAATLATEAYTKSLQNTARETYNSLTPLERLFIDLKKTAGDFWELFFIKPLNEIIKYLEIVGHSFKAVFEELKSFGKLSGDILFSSFSGDLKNIPKAVNSFNKEILSIRTQFSKDFNRITDGSDSKADVSLAKNRLENQKNALNLEEEQKLRDKYQSELKKESAKTLTKDAYVSLKIKEETLNKNVGKDLIQAMTNRFSQEWEGFVKDDSWEQSLKSKINSIKGLVEQEDDIYQARLKNIEAYNSKGLLSIDAYYDAQIAALDENINSQKKAIDKQLSLNRGALYKASSDKDRINLQNEINVLLREQSKLEQDSYQKRFEIETSREEANNEWVKQLQQINIEILELNGNLGEAAAIKFDIQNQELYKKALIENNIELIKQLDLLRESAVARAEGRKTPADFLNDINRKGSVAQSNIIAEQEAYNQALQKGTISAEVYKNKMVELSIASADIKNSMGFGDLDSVLTSGIGQALQNFTTVAEGISNSIGTMFSSLTDGISNAMAAAIVNGENFGDLMANLSRTVLQEFLSSLIKIGIQYALNKVLGTDFAKATADAQLAVTVPAADSIAQAWAPAAALASLASFGANAKPAIGGMILTAAVSKSLASSQFADGGYTGNGGKYEPAGIVHKGEIVWSQSDIANAGGVSIVEAMRKGSIGYINNNYTASPNNTKRISGSDGDVSNVVVNVNISSDGQSKIDSNPDKTGSDLGILIANAVRKEIIKEKRSGGLLSAA